VQRRRERKRRGRCRKCRREKRRTGGGGEEKEKVEMAVGAVAKLWPPHFFFCPVIHVVPHWEEE
jgi:hypothetical protein